MIELSKPFQFSISKSIENVLGINSKVLFNDFKENLEYNYGQKTKNIFKNEYSGEIIIDSGTSNFHPKWQPNNNAFSYITNKKNDFFQSD